MNPLVLDENIRDLDLEVPPSSSKNLQCDCAVISLV